ncbi:MAG: response regulator [Chitinophagaceae bacterium]|nr:response regulator [Anaerolineae bacterium]
MARILFVDDEEMVRVLATLVLRQIGHDVQLANNGLEALRIVKLDVPEILITDLNMPQMTGLQLIQAARRDLPHLPIIALSAHLDYVYAALQLNRIYPLKKPFDKQQLHEAIELAISVEYQV